MKASEALAQMTLSPDEIAQAILFLAPRVDIRLPVNLSSTGATPRLGAGERQLANGCETALIALVAFIAREARIRFATDVLIFGL